MGRRKNIDIIQEYFRENSHGYVCYDRKLRKPVNGVRGLLKSEAELLIQKINIPVLNGAVDVESCWIYQGRIYNGAKSPIVKVAGRHWKASDLIYRELFGDHHHHSVIGVCGNYELCTNPYHQIPYDQDELNTMMYASGRSKYKWDAFLNEYLPKINELRKRGKMTAEIATALSVPYEDLHNALTTYQKNGGKLAKKGARTYD